MTESPASTPVAAWEVVMSASWSSEPVLGLVPHFHLDPTLGGVPLASPDGHWWWDGECWQPRDLPNRRPAA